MPEFKLDSVFTPTADQPKAIAALAEGVQSGERFQTLLGATGTGKTMRMGGVTEGGGGPARRALSDAARRNRHGQDDDDGGRDRGGAASGARDRTQQDARGPAV